jgi:hypothetical protein
LLAIAPVVPVEFENSTNCELLGPADASDDVSVVGLPDMVALLLVAVSVLSGLIEREIICVEPDPVVPVDKIIIFALPGIEVPLSA